jgi:phosphomannomutase
VTTRILSISGLRGIIGDGLDPIYTTRFAAALGTIFCGGKVVVARDGRSTGPMIQHAVISGLLATGCEVLDAGICTTPTCGVLVRHHNAAGGLQITASHNPIEWNGLKPFAPDGSVFNRELGQQLLGILESEAITWKNWSGLGKVTTLADPSQPHIDKVLSLVDVEAIRKKKYRVVLDCNHGSGATCGPRLLEALGCEVIVLGGTPDGRFEHIPEPTEKNLGDLCKAVVQNKAHAGFAQDPDADRMAIVDNDGRYIGEELTLALAADFVLERRKGPFVVNGSTSRVTADIAAKHKCQFHRSFVGEAHVCAKMRSVQAVLGGEGNGGVIDPQVGYVRDSLVSMGVCPRWVDRQENNTCQMVRFASVLHHRQRQNHLPGECCSSCLRSVTKSLPRCRSPRRRWPATRLDRPLGPGPRQQYGTDHPHHRRSTGNKTGSGLD